MATKVQIEVVLDEKGVVQGAQKINTALGNAGKRGNAVFDGMRKNVRESHEAAMLLSQTLGVQLPSSLTRIITRMPAVASAFKFAFRGALVAGVVVGIAETIVNVDVLHKKLVDLGEISVEAWQRLQGLFTGKASPIAEMKADDVALKATEGMRDMVSGIWGQAVSVNKQGMAAIEEQSREMLARLTTAREATLRAAHAQYLDDTDNFIKIEQKADKALADGKIAIAIWEKEQKTKLRKDDLKDLRQKQDEAAMVSLSGLQKLLAQEQSQIRSTREQGAGHPSDVIAAEVVAVRQKTTAEIQKMGQEWTDSVDKTLAEIATQAATGFSKIEIETNRKLFEVTKEFNEKWGAEFIGDPNDPEFQARLDAWTNAFIQFNRERNAITASGAHEREQLMAPVIEETVRMEERAAIASAAPWERANLEIVSGYRDRLREIQQSLDDHLVTEEQAQRQRAALWTETNAQIAEEQRHLRDELAGELESVFDDIASGNIGRRILSEIKRFFSQIVASWILSMGQMRGAVAGIGGGGGGLLGSLLGSIFGTNKGGAVGTPPFVPAGANSIIAGASAIPLFGAGIVAGQGAIPLFGGLSSGAGTAGVAQQQAAQTIFGGILQTQLGKIFTHGLSLGKFKIDGAQLGMLGAGIALESILGGYATASKTLGGIGGAIGGALLGTSILPGIGTAIGAAVGAIAGIFGGIMGGRKRRHQAEDYMKQNVDPALKDILKAYKSFQVDGQAALEQIRQLREQARQALLPLGTQGQEVFQQWGSKFSDARNAINSFETERKNRSFEFAPPQFARGGTVPGPLGAPRLVVAHGGEEIISASAASRSRGELKAINSGQDGERPIHVTVNVNAIDVKGFEQFAVQDRIARAIRRAVRADKLSYSGEGG